MMTKRLLSAIYFISNYQATSIRGRVIILMTMKYIIILVATVGCGKTTTFKALSKLYGWPHIQNDNLKRSPQLVDASLRALQESDVVLVDKNNHEAKQRGKLFEDFEKKRHKILPGEDLTFIAVCLTTSKDKLWDITFSRVKERGDNHQSLQYNSHTKTTIMVMRRFIKVFEAVDLSQTPDSKFESVINVDIAKEGSLEAVTKVIKELGRFGIGGRDDIEIKGVLNEVMEGEGKGKE